jgi:hypothetical protein
MKAAAALKYPQRVDIKYSTGTLGIVRGTFVIDAMIDNQ